MGNAQAEGTLYDAVMAAVAKNELPLPSLPEVALKIGQISRDPDADAERVAAEVNRDPGIAVRLMRVANSAAYRGGAAASNVQAAIARLGLQMVRGLVYALSRDNVFLSDSPLLNAQLRDAWASSVEVAAIAHVLASRVEGLPPETAMLAGLVHRIGVLPIVQIASRHPHLASNAAGLAATIDQLHGSVGQMVLYSWGFPAALVQVPVSASNFARQHSGPPDCNDAVSVACLLADQRKERRFAAVDATKVPAWMALKLEADPWQDAAFVAEVEQRLAWLER